MQYHPAYEELVVVKMLSIFYLFISQELIKATDRSSDEKRNLEIALEAMQVSKLDLSYLVPFHSGQVRNFYLLVLGQVQMYKES